MNDDTFCFSNKCSVENKNLGKSKVMNEFLEQIFSKKKIPVKKHIKLCNTIVQSKEQAALDKCYFEKCPQKAKANLKLLYNKIKNKKNKSKELKDICDNTEKLLSIPNNIKNTPSTDVYIKMYKILYKYDCYYLS
jgi:hypothetical protein